ncbi:MAG: HemK2/MTQ2 family protein methyltransferase [Candidatus Geothermarchaeales archaeon]
MEAKKGGIRVRDGVYPPSEDTHLLLRNLREGAGIALEIGTGSGIIAIELAGKGWWVIATDINMKALRNALDNARHLDLKERIQLIAADLFGFLRRGVEFDLLVFNPPYVPESNQMGGVEDLSWYGGPTGRSTIDRFLEELKDLDVNAHELLLVQSTLSEAERTSRELEERGFKVEFIDSTRSFFEEIILIRAEKSRGP